MADLKTKIYFGHGIIPLGGIIAVATDISGVTYNSGVMDECGWQLCDGQPIDSGATLSGSTYTLNDSRFLMGSTSAGTTGGSNSIPDHRHEVTNASVANASTTRSGTNTFSTPGSGTLYSNYTRPNFQNYDGSEGWQVSNSTSSNKKTIRWVNNTGNSSSDQCRAANHRHSIGSHGHSTGNITHNASYSLTSTALTGYVGTGANYPTSTVMLPKYVSVQYVMRVK